MKKNYFKLVTLSFLVLSAVPVVVPSTVAVADELAVTQRDTSEISFSNSDFLAAAEQAYTNGLITKSEYNKIFVTLTNRWGNGGVNKSVYLGNNMTDIYISGGLWSVVVGSGTAAIASIVSLIPGINATVAGMISGGAGAYASYVASAEKGVIIRVRLRQRSDGSYFNEFVSIREQK